LRSSGRNSNGLFGVDKIVAAMLALVEADVVEYEELGLSAEQSCVATPVEARYISAFCDIAGVAVVALLSDRIYHMGDEHQG